MSHCGSSEGRVLLAELGEGRSQHSSWRDGTEISCEVWVVFGHADGGVRINNRGCIQGWRKGLSVASGHSAGAVSSSVVGDLALCLRCSRRSVRLVAWMGEAYI